MTGQPREAFSGVEGAVRWRRGEVGVLGRTDVARRLLHALAAGEPAEVEACTTEDYVFHSQLDGKPSGRAALRDRALLLASALHEAVLSIELVLEDGDHVAVRWTGRAVHRGDLVRVPASGRPVEVRGITIFRFVGDLVREEWTEFDGLGLLAQITPDT